MIYPRYSYADSWLLATIMTAGAPAAEAGVRLLPEVGAAVVVVMMAAGDLAVVDLAVVDLAVADLAAGDLAVADLAIMGVHRAPKVGAMMAVGDLAVADLAMIGEDMEEATRWAISVPI